MRFPLSYLLIAIGGPLGYFAGYALTYDPEAAPDSPPLPESVVTRNPGAPLAPTITGSLESSSMVAEWDRLNANEGGTDFSQLFARIKKTEDPFRRRAFRAAALSDWVGRDPRGTLAFLRGKDKWMTTQFVREWLRTDPNAAINQLLADGAASRSELSSLLEDIAKLAPERLAEICLKSGAGKTPATVSPEGFSESSSSGSINPEKAFASFAGQDLEAARAAALGLTGSTRDRALAGVGGAWAEKDGVAALAWAESLPPGKTRDGVLQRVLAGWAKTDPFAALGKLDLLPKATKVDEGGNRIQGSSQDNTVSQVLAEASKKDWYGTMTWLQEHPERSGIEVVNGLSAAFSRRLRDDPVPMLRDIMANEAVLFSVFQTAITGEGYAQRDAVWTWLQEQPKSATVDNLRYSMLNAVAYKEPEAALDLIRNFPDSEENRMMFSNVANSMFSRGNGIDAAKLEEWYQKAPLAMRPSLLRNALNHSTDISANAATWVARLGEMPADLRGQVVPALASGWAGNDPDAASKWALALPNAEDRARAFESVAHVWVSNDEESFATVLETLPRGKERDSGTAALAQTLLQSDPEVAWSWAAEIQNESARLQSLQMVYGYYAGRNRAAADELLKSANLPEAQVKQFQQHQQQYQQQFQTQRGAMRRYLLELGAY